MVIWFLTPSLLEFPVKFYNLSIKIACSLGISNGHPWCGYGYFLDLFNITLPPEPLVGHQVGSASEPPFKLQ